MKQMRKKNILIISFLLVIITISLCGFVFCILFAYTYLFEDDNPPQDDVRLYRYYQVNPEIEETSSKGFVTLPLDTEIDESGFFYTEENGNAVLISKFDSSKEYVCNGVCSCSSSKRRNSMLISRGITYLVAAFSSVIAYNQAKEYFEEECVNMMMGEEECLSDQEIKSRIDECRDSDSSNNNRKEYTDMFGEDDEDMDEGERMKKEHKLDSFLCHGKCSGNKKSTTDSRLIKLQETECKKESFEGYVSVSCIGYDDISTCEEKLVRVVFKNEYMTKICREHGITTAVYEGLHYGYRISKKGENWERLRTLCTADEVNDIRCRLQEKPPEEKFGAPIDWESPQY